MIDSNTGGAMPAECAKAEGCQEPITLEQLAEIEFEPWEHKANEWEPPGDLNWAAEASSVLLYVRVAWFVMYKTKAELGRMYQSPDGEAWNLMYEGIEHSLKFFENFVTILNSAQIRMLCAAGSAELRRGSPSEA
jgi:hypothetical protein